MKNLPEPLLDRISKFFDRLSKIKTSTFVLASSLMFLVLFISFYTVISTISNSVREKWANFHPNYSVSIDDARILQTQKEKQDAVARYIAGKPVSQHDTWWISPRSHFAPIRRDLIKQYADEEVLSREQARQLLEISRDFHYARAPLHDTVHP
ncbi:hypothetical protein COB55_00095 [Candidatus Wolfebacteria bacterium]|nr:MAG: hypothetical protein COB55_00095 [Candidatus Wolfebacteria bacterium]